MVVSGPDLEITNRGDQITNLGDHDLIKSLIALQTVQRKSGPTYLLFVFQALWKYSVSFKQEMLYMSLDTHPNL